MNHEVLDICRMYGLRALISLASQPDHRGEIVDGTGELRLLDGARRIDILRADDRAGADKAALPDALMCRDHVLPRLAADVAGIQVVALRQRQRRRADEFPVSQTVLRAGGIAEQAIDAHRVLLVGL